MWKKLETHYDNTSASVQAALAGLQQLKLVESEDYRALIELVDEVEAAYCQLQKLNHVNILTMRDVDHISEHLPSHIRVEWIRKYHDMSSGEKVYPFPYFMKFLEREREAVAHLPENQPAKKRFQRHEKGRVKGHNYQTHAATQGGKFYKGAYPAHRKDNINHTTSECNELKKMAVSGKQGRYELLKEVNACLNALATTRGKTALRKTLVRPVKANHITSCCAEKRNLKKTHQNNRKPLRTAKKRKVVIWFKATWLNIPYSPSHHG